MNPQPIHVFATWKVKPDHLNTVLDLLPHVVRGTTSEPGNLFYQVHQHNSDPSTLILFEGYSDEAALDFHRKSEHFQTLVVGKIVPLLESREVILSTPLTL